MLYSSFTLSLLNNVVQNLLRNLRSWLMISLLERLQLIKSSLLKKAYAHCSTVQVSIPSINVIYFENLHMTDINVLYPFLLAGSARTKLRIRIKKGTRVESISCRDP